jgi:hypothetical protein
MAQYHEVEFERALFPDDVLGWLAATQPDQLANVVKGVSTGSTTAEQGQLLDRLVKVRDTPMENGGGTLNVLPVATLELKTDFTQSARRRHRAVQDLPVLRAGEGRRCGGRLSGPATVAPPKVEGNGLNSGGVEPKTDHAGP